MSTLLIKFIKHTLEKYPLQDPLLRLFLWQWMAIGTVVFLGALFAFVILSLLEIFLLKRKEKLDGLGRIKGWGTGLGIVWLLVYVLPDLELDPRSGLLSNLILSLRMIGSILILLFISVVNDVLMQIVFQRFSKKYPDRLGVLQIGRSLFKVVVMGLALLFVPRFFFFYDLASLMTKLSIGAGTLTAIVALASKDLISNFFGALVIMIGRPFKVGDFIIVDKFEGRVVGIDVRATKLQMDSGGFVYVPNGVFTNKHVKNYGDGIYVPIEMSLELGKGAGNEHLDSFLNSVESILAGHPSLFKRQSRFVMDKIDKERLRLTLHLSLKRMGEKEKISHLHTLVQQIEQEAEGIKA